MKDHLGAPFSKIYKRLKFAPKTVNLVVSLSKRSDRAYNLPV